MIDHTVSFEDFTEKAYRDLIRSAKRHWQFITFPDHAQKSRGILWRHDIDISPQRALALAMIEKEEGVHSTFFVLLHSQFYNPLERTVADAIIQIAQMGHHIGLHFDPTFYKAEISTNAQLDDHLRFEKTLLESILNTNVAAVSWHNPTSSWLSKSDDLMAGMTNAYSRSIHDRYRYISDSNGVWRHDRLADVVEAGDTECLQVLTHPEWWVPSASAPRDRVLRAIQGRADATVRYYDAALQEFGRPNVGAKPE